MATNSCVVVKIKVEDLDTTKKFDPSKVIVNEWENKDERREVSLCEDVKIESDYMAIYVHWDGQSVGENLANDFSDYEDALNLVLGGDCSAIHSDKEIIHYANRKEGCTWDDIKPKQCDNLESLLEHYKYCPCIYVHFDGAWHECNKTENGYLYFDEI